LCIANKTSWRKFLSVCQINFDGFFCLVLRFIVTKWAQSTYDKKSDFAPNASLFTAIRKFYLAFAGLQHIFGCFYKVSHPYLLS